MFDNLTECLICGKTFKKIRNKDICVDCREKEQELFMSVKDYLYDYPDASVQEVEEQTDVNAELIQNWLKEGRLQKGEASKNYPCQMCGRPIHMGKICKTCKEELGSNTNDTDSLDDNKPKHHKGMYVSEKFK